MTGDLSVVTFAHFIWLPKPWSRAIDDAILGVKGAIDEGHRTGHSFIAFATPWWVNRWRDFARTVKGQFFEHDFRTPGAQIDAVANPQFRQQRFQTRCTASIGFDGDHLGTTAVGFQADLASTGA